MTEVVAGPGVVAGPEVVARPGEAGMVTAETAVVLPAIMLVFATLLGILSAETAQIRCVDAAGQAARSAATGASLATVTATVRRSIPDATVRLTTSGGLVTVSISAPVPHLPSQLVGLQVGDSATAATSGVSAANPAG